MMPATRSRRFDLWLALAGCLCLAAALPLTADARSSTTREYRGHLIGYPKVRSISLEVNQNNGRYFRARFRVKRLGLICDGGTPDQAFVERAFGPDRFPFVGPAVFQGQRYTRLGGGNWSYYEVKGRLLGGGRAKGYVYYLQDSYGPLGNAGPECSTGGQLYHPWRAKRVQR